MGDMADLEIERLESIEVYYFNTKTKELQKVSGIELMYGDNPELIPINDMEKSDILSILKEYTTEVLQYVLQEILNLE